eukprot:548560-Pyramimonas_sp.AAC.1
MLRVFVQRCVDSSVELQTDVVIGFYGRGGVTIVWCGRTVGAEGDDRVVRGSARWEAQRPPYHQLPVQWTVKGPEWTVQGLDWISWIVRVGGEVVRALGVCSRGLQGKRYEVCELV